MTPTWRGNYQNPVRSINQPATDNRLQQSQIDVLVSVSYPLGRQSETDDSWIRRQKKKQTNKAHKHQMDQRYSKQSHPLLIHFPDDYRRLQAKDCKIRTILLFNIKQIIHFIQTWQGHQTLLSSIIVHNSLERTFWNTLTNVGVQL